MSAPMSAAELRALIEGQTTTDLWTAARALGVGRDWAYAAFERGELPFPAFRLGRAIRVPTAPLGRLLGVDLAGDDEAAEVRSASVHPISAGHGGASGEENRWNRGRDAS